MTLAQNHQQLSSGNKYLVLVLSVLFLSACSSKIRTESKSPKAIDKPATNLEKPVVKLEQATISLLAPFRLNEVKLKTAAKADVEKAAMAIDFYQGFKLGVDSAAASGQNFKLKVYDAGDNNAQLAALIDNGSLLGSHLIVGPVFPNGLKYISNYSISRGIPVVNPLSAAHPSEFSNPNLISIVNNVDQHADKIGNYISKNFNPASTVVVLINPKAVTDEVMAKPIRSYFHQNNKFSFQEYASVFTMETKIVKGKQYVVIISSSDRKFVVPTLDKLIKIQKAGLNISLFGHPDWIKQNYSTEQLQTLNTIISSSYKIDYTRPEVTAFIKKYRASFNFEPGEYSFKGFDIGLYFGKMLSAYGVNYIKQLHKENYKGLHNSFRFVYDSNLGFLNTNLMLLKYKNFALNSIE